MEAELSQNFTDRYGNKWHRSKRNHPNTKILDPAAARQSLGIGPDRKVAAIYSHIRYDTLFFRHRPVPRLLAMADRNGARPSTTRTPTG